MADENGTDNVEETAEDISEGVVEKGKAIAGEAVDAAKDAADVVAVKAGDTVDAVGDVAGGAADTAKDVAVDAVDRGKEVVGDAAGAVADAFDGDGDGGSVLNWLMPLLLLGLVLVLWFMYCSKPGTNVGTNTTDANNVSNSNINGGSPNTDATPAGESAKPDR